MIFNQFAKKYVIHYHKIVNVFAFYFTTIRVWKMNERSMIFNKFTQKNIFIFTKV